MNASRYLSLYFAEADQNLRELDAHVLALEGAGGADALHAAFRAAHNLKGMSATVGFTDVATRAHVLEDRLDGLRRSENLDATTVDELLGAVDALRAAVDRARSEEPDAVDEAASPERRVGDASYEAPGGCAAVARVVFRPDTPLRSVRATLAVRKAREVAALVGHAPDTDQEFDGDLLLFLAERPEGTTLEDVLLGVGDVEAVVVEEPMIAAEPGQDTEEAGTYVRVERRHADALADGVGALAAQHARLAELSAGASEEVDAVLDGMGRLLAGLRVAALGVRLVPVSEVFDRFPRLVRDAARSAGREVEFKLEGRSNELDRVILDELAEPILHLLRNAVDHGIEPPEEREAAGKPHRGRLVLRARRARAGVAVEVEDDGRGVPVDAVRGMAVEAGLVTESDAETWTAEEMLGVLSRPGFSAAGGVSELSGRGVGLDIVVERVRGLGGAVELETREGRGTTFRLRLPVSLSAAEAVWVRLGSEEYAVPLTHVFRAVEAGDGVERTGNRLAVEDDVYAVVELANVLGVPDGGESGSAALLVDVGGRRAALLVDALLGREDVVVKELDAPRGAHPLLSGVTLRGDGRPALVLDPAAVV